MFEQFAQNKPQELELDMIDFKFVEEEKNPKRLKKALKILEQDGNYFFDLVKAIEEKLMILDPKFRNQKLIERQGPSSYDKAMINNEISDYVKEAEKNEKRRENLIEEIDPVLKKKRAENEKNKGNEAMKSNDLKEALQYYKKSIEYDPTLSASWCNRALVNLKLKNYQDCINDCNKALEIDNTYLKAYHRRGKAYLEQKEFFKAVQDFQYIMEKEPENQEVNADLLDARRGLPKEDKQFKRVTIMEEDDDDDDNEVTISDDQGNEEQVISDENEKLDKIFSEVTKMKNDGQELIKNGLFTEAINLFNDTASKLNSGSFKKTDSLIKIGQKRAECLSNVALCHMQLQENSKVIATINLLLQDEDIIEKNIIVKAYLRRGLAFEKIERFGRAKQDFEKVKQLDPSNMQSSQGLHRVTQFALEESQKLKDQNELEVKQETQAKNKYVSEPLKNQTLSNEEVKKALRELGQPVHLAMETEAERRQRLTNLKQITKQNKISTSTSIEEYETLKDNGNLLFKQKKFHMSFEQFTLAIEKIEKKHIKLLQEDGKYYKYQMIFIQFIESQVKTIYLQLLTNRALCGIQLKNYDQTIIDCNMTLNYDSNNLKAIYRRALANMEKAQYLNENDPENTTDLSLLNQQVEQYEKAKKDIEAVLKRDATNDTAKNKLNEVIKLIVRLKLSLKNTDEQPKSILKNKRDSNQQDVVEKPRQKGPESEYLDKITQNVTSTVMEDLINKKELPSNPSVFEKNCQSFKKNIDKLFHYLQTIPNSHILKLYNKKDIPTEIILMIIQTLQDKNDSPDYCLELLQTLAQTNKFDLQIMCLTKSEKKQISSIIDQIHENLELTQKPKILDIRQKYQLPL